MSNKDTDAGLEFLESPEGLAGELNKFEKKIEKNRKLLLIVGGVLVVGLLGWFGYNWYIKSQDEEAQVLLFSPFFAFEADSLNKTLNGSAGSPGVLAISEEYDNTPAGNLAALIAGTSLLKQGKFDQAIEKLKSFSSSDLVIQGKAYALIGDAYMEKNQPEEAISYYQKAVDYKPSAYFTPGYMIKLGVAYEKAKKNQEAIKVYTNLIEKYPQAAEVLTAKKNRAFLEAAAE
ncbi:MAG: tetratricopeptide repeat protein [Runella sp.]